MGFDVYSPIVVEKALVIGWALNQDMLLLQPLCQEREARKKPPFISSQAFTTKYREAFKIETY